ncbi:hypothetical protein U6N30_28735 [Blastococcus brunescens]|uniref:Uncharacterized protein n=1 Tax=Blastococcus brunescens TaxID=1564165 RepID=A0ABZ1B1J3_9ACTN|nr:hypothetical protein [Blastococcus sp. BMG 8361]WRL63616.1 hypothetical protein U6N30_28735 [Blastococcus sp. BMG 8361]
MYCVSGAATFTAPIGRPSRSAASWPSTVCAPCPISTEEVSTCRLPSASRRTAAFDVDGVIVDFRMTAMPLARTRVSLTCTRRSSGQPIAAALRSRRSFQRASCITSPVAKVDPSVRRFRCRSSTGSIPSRSAISSICDSYAQAACETPYPR